MRQLEANIQVRHNTNSSPISQQHSENEISHLGVEIKLRKKDQVEGTNVGEIVAINKTTGVGLALLRLDIFAEPISEDIVLRSDVNLHNQDGVDIVPFRPFWWPDLDPVTNKPVF